MQITLDHLIAVNPGLQVMSPAQRNDASEGTFFALELQFIEKSWVNVDYPMLKARDIIPIDTSAGPGADTIAYYMFDRVGAAKVMSDQATDFPLVDVFGTKFVSQVRSLGDAIQYSFQELRAAQMAGRSIETMRFDNAHDLMRRLENQLAFTGSASWGFNGFLTFANVPVSTAPADGVGSTTSWTNKTPDQMLRDMHLPIANVLQNSLGIEDADTLLMPLSLYNIARNTRLGNVSDKTVLQFFKENNPGVTVDWLLELETAGTVNAAPAKRMMAFRRNPAKVKMHIPQDFEMFPPVYTGAGYKVNCHSRFGGVVFYKPVSAVYLDGM